MASASVFGLKGCTTRNHRYGFGGEEFSIRSGQRVQAFVLKGVYRVQLGSVAERLYMLEGFRSPEAFIKVWVE